MSLVLKSTINKTNYFSLLLALFPVAFVAGNMIINLNIIVIIFSCLFLFKKHIFQIKYYFLDILILIFFSLILFTGFLNDYSFYLRGINWRGNFSTIIVSILFLKYLILYISLRFLTEKKILNFKLFFISCLLVTLFVSIDIFYQLYNGKDIFGYESTNFGRKLSGPFGDELIAGGFIQRFSVFSFFLFPIFYYEKSRKYSKFLIPILFFIFSLGIILSGNRMPLILFIFTIFLIFIFNKKIRGYLLSFFIIFSLIFFLTFKFNNKVRDNFLTFQSQIFKIIIVLNEKNINQSNTPQYLKEFSTFYETWKMHKYFGGGIKNFRYYCHERPNIYINSKFICNMHPHNYYLEILTETGVVGFIIILSIFTTILYLSFYKKYFTNTILKNNNLIVPFIFLFIAEIFPIKSTGSFFTTGNTTYLIILMAIIVGLMRRENFIEK
jgi:O-antigen ligase